MNAAPISMAQQARPHWYIHSEYFRAVFSSLVSGFGMWPLSTRPMWVTTSDPAEDTLAPRVHEAKGEHDDEHDHLDEAEDVVDLQARGPGEDEDGFDVEHDEEQGEDVVADLALAPTE